MKTSKNLKFNNTYSSGKVSFLIFKEKDKFVGVCLEFDLEATGKTAKEAQDRIEEYAKGWHENVVKNKLPEELLNKEAPKEYWEMFERIKQISEKRQVLTAKVLKQNPFQIVMSSLQLYSPQLPLAQLI